MINTELIKFIAESEPLRKNVVTYMRQVQDEVADVRNGNYPMETRLQTVAVIEDLIIKKLSVLSRKSNGEDEE
jgi:hypothetical protein